MSPDSGLIAHRGAWSGFVGAELGGHRDVVTVAVHRDLHGVVGLVTAQHRADVVGAGDLGVVDLHDHVSHLQPGQFGGRVGRHALDVGALVDVEVRLLCGIGGHG